MTLAPAVSSDAWGGPSVSPRVPNTAVLPPPGADIALMLGGGAGGRSQRPAPAVARWRGHPRHRPAPAAQRGPAPGGHPVPPDRWAPRRGRPGDVGARPGGDVTPLPRDRDAAGRAAGVQPGAAAAGAQRGALARGAPRGAAPQRQAQGQDAEPVSPARSLWALLTALIPGVNSGPYWQLLLLVLTLISTNNSFPCR